MDLIYRKILEFCGQSAETDHRPALREDHAPTNRQPRSASLQGHPHQHDIETHWNPYHSYPVQPSLAQLGYEAHLERREAWGDAGTHSLYTIRESSPPGPPHVPPRAIIAQLSALDHNHNHAPETDTENTDPEFDPVPEDIGAGGLLVVHHLATEDDSRRDGNDPSSSSSSSSSSSPYFPARPRARDLLTAFWTDTLGRRPHHLRALRFEAVVETHTRRALRDLVCPLLGVPYDRCTDGPRGAGGFALLRPTSSPPSDERGVASACEEAEAWGHLCRGSRLVRVAMGMTRRLGMAAAAPGEEGEVEVVRIEVVEGFDKHGNSSAFDLICVFGTVGTVST